MKVSLCEFCKHLNKDGGSCPAFPEGILPDVSNGKVDHRLPVEGDHGIQFELAQGAEDSYFFDPSLLTQPPKRRQTG